MSPDDYCAARTAASGSSFYYAFRFLPSEQRRAITALYAFCREVDDVVDHCSEPALARTKLDWWRGEVAQAYAGQPQHPVTRALSPQLQRFDLAREYLEEILDGMEMDLTHTGYGSYSELRLYCHRVAGVVGVLSAQIFGYRERATLRYAGELGIALQLVNILRDVREDAQRGRVYLPADALSQYRVRPEELTLTTTSERLVALLRDHAARARQSYHKALSLLPESDRLSQAPGLIMGRIYMTLLDEIERNGYRVLEHGVRLTPLRKLWIAWRSYHAERRRARQ
jgi:phytoene synthase